MFWSLKSINIHLKEFIHLQFFMIWLLVSRGGYLKVSGRGESHCRSVGTELPGQEETMRNKSKIWEQIHLEQLVHDVLSVDALEDVSLLDHVVEVGLHELEDEVEVLVVGRPVHVQQLDDVWVAPKLFQKDDFPRTMIFSRVDQNMKCYLNVRWASVLLRKASKIFFTATIVEDFRSVAFQTTP